MKNIHIILSILLVLLLVPQEVFAGTIRFVGDDLRKEAFLKFFPDKSDLFDVQERISGPCGGNPKNECPGIFVFNLNSEGEETSTFITVLDETARTEGLCEQQEKDIRSFLEAVPQKVTEEIVMVIETPVTEIAIKSPSKMGEVLEEMETEEVVVEVLVMRLVFNIWNPGGYADVLWCEKPESQSRNLSDQILQAENVDQNRRFPDEVSLVVRFFGTEDNNFAPPNGREGKSFFRKYVEYTIPVTDGKAVFIVDQRWLGKGTVEIRSSNTKFRYPGTGVLRTYAGELVPRGDDNQADFHFVVKEKR